MSDGLNVYVTVSTTPVNVYCNMSGGIPGPAGADGADGPVWTPTGNLALIQALTLAADKLIYATAVDAVALATLTAFARTLIDDADAAAMRSTLGLGTIATEAATDYVAKSLFDANTILAANSDNTPAAVTVAEDRILGRKAGGNIAGLTGAEAAAILSTSGELVQVVNYTTGALASGTTTFPCDDTIPQNTEGDEYLTVSITPKNAANTLVIIVNLFASNGVVAICGMGLFQDSTAGALAATAFNPGNDNYCLTPTLVHKMTAGGTSETTFKVRAGNNGSGTFRINGRTAGRLFGGVASSSITIFEIAA